MVSLPQVTLLCADTKQPLEAAAAVKKCCEGVSFGAVRLLTDTQVPLTCGEVIQIPTIQGWQAYSRFCFKELWRFCQTEFLLICQHDGHVISPEHWSNDFLEWDYVGSPWPNGPINERVGNGGFSLRSLRLQKWLAREDNGIHVYHPEDVVICRVARKKVDQAGFRIAPLEVAEQFGTRHPAGELERKTFGFHCQKKDSHKSKYPQSHQLRKTYELIGDRSQNRI